MATVTVNGRDIEIGDKERLNCVLAAQRAGVDIPHYCYHPALSVVASCRMCLVEIGEKKPDGTVAMQPRVVPGCQTPVKDGTVVVSDSPKAKAAQAGTLEYILLNHPLDCPICDQAGECYLQDYSYKFGKGESRLNEPKTYHPDKYHIGEQIVLFTDRCVMCSRCVRFTREISGTGELQIINRGNHAEIDVFPGKPCNNKLAGNVVDICPVGALCSKDFLYKQRVWWLTSKASACPTCSTGCSINVDQNEDKVYRLKPRTNPQSQGHFMCDEGRFGFKYVHRPDRLQTPFAKEPGQAEVEPTPKSWSDVLAVVRSALKQKAPGVVGVLSPFMTVEEAYLAAKFLKGLGEGVPLALGPVPMVGVDDHYPKAPDGNVAPGEPKFTIRAEKCPNRLGVEAILKHFQGEAVEWTKLLPDAESGKLTAGIIFGGYDRSWITEAQAATLRKLSYLVVQDILPSPASDIADAVLPGGSFAEKDGTFINHKKLAQAIRAAVRSPGEARADGRILMELAERRGLFHAASLRKEIAAEIPYFAALAAGDIGELGVFVGAPVPAMAAT
ncbi:MAG TPA: molybdopterin-dependent oxidoreductase [Planctomycetia bacterium]|nr:molybdopterin-dependent oxidoreductase [Planctomycetia bacterium]